LIGLDWYWRNSDRRIEDVGKGLRCQWAWITTAFVIMRSNVQSPAVPAQTITGSWWKPLDGYQRQVFILATLAWMFDCLGQQVFVIARNPALSSLMPPGTSPDTLKAWGGYATSIFVVGWATGGLIFGALGDRIGRARALAITMLLYGLCTGLSGFSVGLWDFCAYRFITGLGVGGVFGLAVALCADALPDRSRPSALGLLQALSAVGNMAAGGAAIALGYRKLVNPNGVDPWRMLFVLGAIPALLCLVFQFRLPEPEKWVKARAQGKITGVQFGSYASLFGEERWRRNALFGMVSSARNWWGTWRRKIFRLPSCREKG
jgi:MFS family permease